MAAPIIGGLETYITEALDLQVWDGETPRQGTAGEDIGPDSPTNISPQLWPAVNVTMYEGGVQRNWSFVNAYGDEGPILIEIWAQTREEVQAVLDDLEALLAKDKEAIPLGEGFQFYKLLLDNWTIIQEKNKRDGNGQLLYYGNMRYDIGVHGSIATR